VAQAKEHIGPVHDAESYHGKCMFASLTPILRGRLFLTDVPGLILWSYLINKGNFYFYSQKCSHVYNGLIVFC
jgi:hypothetical protein